MLLGCRPMWPLSAAAAGAAQQWYSTCEAVSYTQGVLGCRPRWQNAAEEAAAAAAEAACSTSSKQRVHRATNLFVVLPQPRSTTFTAARSHHASTSCASAKPLAAAVTRWNRPPERASSGSSAGRSSGSVTVSAYSRLASQCTRASAGGRSGADCTESTAARTWFWTAGSAHYYTKSFGLRAGRKRVSTYIRTKARSHAPQTVLCYLHGLPHHQLCQQLRLDPEMCLLLLHDRNCKTCCHAPQPHCLCRTSSCASSCAWLLKGAFCCSFTRCARSRLATVMLRFRQRNMVPLLPVLLLLV